ncbi:glycosyltransferase family 4 protein [filamentous cyanobacterium LEGE 11480]|uniref:Glycosyltransferase family 4 protein n=1 Tax=Romeriopsis navalis LEGE 11480 TaxID=2777977 RepID=A0A928VJ25_9CYAN|nr:glycosyltransferase family 4 protein [Romeriopsis navalis]MBE9029533.1 glycosyltransferase family 4 protein [Romeriopsis navalis LEGE 11480]
MKIAMGHVDLPNQSKGGVASQAHKIANALVQRGHQVTMFTLSPSYDECLYAVHQYPANPLLLKFLNPFWFAICLARTDFAAYDVVHTHGDNFFLAKPHPQVRTYNGSAKDEAKSAVRFRRRLYQQLMSFIEVQSTRYADVNVGISETTRRNIPNIDCVIPCGVDLQDFHPGLKSTCPTILFVGTADGRKRGQWLANIFSHQVRAQLPNAELWAVSDQPLKGDGIVNLGRVSHAELCERFRSAWAFCLPSTYEGFGVPYIEAMAAGTTTIASPNPGAQEVLAEGEYGMIVPDAKLGDAMLQVLTDVELREHYAQRGIRRAENYSWPRVVMAYETLYDDLQMSSPRICSSSKF